LIYTHMDTERDNTSPPPYIYQYRDNIELHSIVHIDIHTRGYRERQ